VRRPRTTIRGLMIAVAGAFHLEYSAYADREVSVEIIDGPRKGAFGTIKRSLLRVK
jgi:hypothetical protein